MSGVDTIVAGRSQSALSATTSFDYAELDRLIEAAELARDKVLMDVAKDARDSIKREYRATYAVKSKKQGGELVQSVKAFKRPKKRGGGAKLWINYVARFLEFGTKDRKTRDRSGVIPKKGRKKFLRKTGKTSHSTGKVGAIPIATNAAKWAFMKAISRLGDEIIEQYHSPKFKMPIE